VGEIVLEDVIGAFLFHARPAASGAVLPELYGGIFADRREPRIGFTGMNMIFFRHFVLQSKLKVRRFWVLPSGRGYSPESFTISGTLSSHSIAMI
jgi:hypothetical protein